MSPRGVIWPLNTLLHSIFAITMGHCDRNCRHGHCVSAITAYEVDYGTKPWDRRKQLQTLYKHYWSFHKRH